jgi:hypothetical protein
VARRQQAKSLELRAALGLLRDLKKRGNSDRRPPQLAEADRGDLRVVSATRRL